MIPELPVIVVPSLTSMIVYIKIGMLAPAVFLSCIRNMEIFDYPVWEWIMTSLSHDITPDGDRELVKTILANYVETCPAHDYTKSTFTILEEFKRDNGGQVLADVIHELGQNDSDFSSDTRDTDDNSNHSVIVRRPGL